jgi:putative hydrolase of the HAD superfamily
MLHSIPLTKVIFTNATVEHAQNVLNILGIADQFADIIDVRRVEYVSKPNAAAYQRLLDILQARGDECILIEDATRNLLPGKVLGMTTILVDSAASRSIIARTTSWVKAQSKRVKDTGREQRDTDARCRMRATIMIEK